MKIEVTQGDIDNGTPHSLTHCPIALAIKRHRPDWSVSVGRYSTVMTRRNWICRLYVEDQYEIDMPPEAVQFTGAYDAGSEVSPITFDLDIPQ